MVSCSFLLPTGCKRWTRGWPDEGKQASSHHIIACRVTPLTLPSSLFYTRLLAASFSSRLPLRPRCPSTAPAPLPPPPTQIYTTTSSLFIGFLDAACARAAAKAAGGAGGVAGGPQQQKNKGQGSDGKYQGE
jgi:hypothetical protein